MFVCVLMFQMCGFFVYSLLWLCIADAWSECLCLHVYVCSWQPLRACVSLVVFRSIKQFRHLHGLLLRAEDPKKCLTVVQKPRVLLTNICSHCELLACDAHFTRRRHTPPHIHTHMQTRRRKNAMPRLIYHFSNISGKWQPVGNICSCCLFCLTGCAAQAFSALKGECH